MRSNPPPSGLALRATTPDDLESAMQGIADVRVKEVRNRRFSAEFELFSLPRTALFRLVVPNSRLSVPGGSEFIAVNVITRGEARTESPCRGKTWLPGTAHVVDHQNCDFEFTSDANLSAIALCFQKPMLRDYAGAFRGPDDIGHEFTAEDVSLESSAGQCLARYTKFVWDELNRGDAFLRSPIAAQELEDSLWAMLLSAMTDSQSKARLRGCYSTYIQAAEDYIIGHLDEPLRVVDIASAVGVSVPTLNRVFRKSHGIGPQAFAKLRRLERARSLLRSADRQSTTVTEIAMRFGFAHMSQFAADYKRAFHESPSATLRRG